MASQAPTLCPQLPRRGRAEAFQRELNSFKLVLHGVPAAAGDLRAAVEEALRSAKIVLDDQSFVLRVRRLSGATVIFTCSSLQLRRAIVAAKHALPKGLTVDVALTRWQSAVRKQQRALFAILKQNGDRPIWHYERICVWNAELGKHVPFLHPPPPPATGGGQQPPAAASVRGGSSMAAADHAPSTSRANLTAAQAAGLAALDAAVQPVAASGAELAAQAATAPPAPASGSFAAVVAAAQSGDQASLVASYIAAVNSGAVGPSGVAASTAAASSTPPALHARASSPSVGVGGGWALRRGFLAATSPSAGPKQKRARARGASAELSPGSGG
jgi:hypothetical protein